VVKIEELEPKTEKKQKSEWPASSNPALANPARELIA